LASLSDPAAGLKDASAELELRVVELLKNFLNQLNPELPAVLTTHASVQGAMYGNERSVMLGKDIVLPGSLVRDPRLDYVALGHIHKPQELNSNAHPPVIYPGSIERVDFGEVDDDKHFVIAQVEKGKTRVEWRKLVGRKFFDRKLELVTSDDVQGQLERILPPPQAMKDAIGRLNLYYPREWEAFIDEPALRRYAQAAFEFHFFRHPQIKIGARLPAGESLLGKTTADQLDFYWKNMGLSAKDLKQLKPLAEEIMAQVHSGFSPDQNDEPL